MFNGPAEMMQPSNMRVNANGQGGVQEAVFGNDGAIAFEFSTLAQRNEAKSVALGFDHYDLLEVIHFYPDRYTKTCSPVTDAHRRKYPDAYRRFKEGLGSRGTKIRDWNFLNDAEQATLIAGGVHTVEQLAEISGERLAQMPTKAPEWIERAKMHVKSQNAHEEVKDYAQAIAEMNAKLAALADENRALRANRDSALIVESDLDSEPTEAPRKRGRPSKKTTEE
jgi:hypothetical protein